MADFPRSASIHLARFFSAENLYHSHGPIFLPFYHTVSNKNLNYIKNYPYRNEKEFERELDYILNYFTPVSLEDLMAIPAPDKKVFHLSFDDGLKECTEIIAPILLRKGIPATFFINTGFVDNKNLFHRYKASLILTHLKQTPDVQAELFFNEHGLNRENILRANFQQSDILDEAAELMELDFGNFLENERPYLSTKEIKKLHKSGFSIGGHGHDHPEFWTLKPKEQRRQIEKSMEWLDKHIQPKIRAFSFPFTDDKVSEKLLKKLKKDAVCDITFGTAGLKYDTVSSHLQRVPMEQNRDVNSFLKGEFLYFKLRKLVKRDIVKH